MKKLSGFKILLKLILLYFPKFSWSIIIRSQDKLGIVLDEVDFRQCRNIGKLICWTLSSVKDQISHQFENLSLIMKSESIRLRNNLLSINGNSLVPRPFFVTGFLLLKLMISVDFPLSAWLNQLSWIFRKFVQIQNRKSTQNLESWANHFNSDETFFPIFRCSSRLWLSHQIWPTSSSWTLSEHSRIIGN